MPYQFNLQLKFLKRFTISQVVFYLQFVVVLYYLQEVNSNCSLF